MCVCGWEWLGVGFGGGGASGSRIVRAVLAACSAVPRRIPLCRPSHPPHRPTRRHDAHVLTLFCILRLWSPSSLSRHSSFSTSVPSFPTLHSSSSTTVPPPPPHTHTHSLTHTQHNFISLTPVSSIARPSLSPTKSGTPTHLSLCEQCNLCVYSVHLYRVYTGCAAACNQGAQSVPGVQGVQDVHGYT